MHHLTTLNLPTPSSKDADRQMIAAAMAEYCGEQVTESPIEARPLVSHQWSAANMTVIPANEREAKRQHAARKGGRPTGTVVGAPPELVDRARAMAGIGLTRYAAARQLKIGDVRLARICTEHGITFKAKAA